MDNPTLALTASLLSMIFVIIAYFVKNKSLYLAFQASCIVFLVISYFFTMQFFAMVGLSIGLIRALVFFTYEKKDKDAPLLVSFAFVVAATASYLIINLWILKTAQPLDLLCLSASIMYSFIFRIRNLKIVRYMMLIPTTLSILFNALTNAAIFATLSYVFELLANIVSIFSCHMHKRKMD